MHQTNLPMQHAGVIPPRLLPAEPDSYNPLVKYLI